MFEQRARVAARTVSIGPSMSLCRIAGDLLIYVDPTDLSVAPHLMMDGFWEAWTSVAVQRLLKPGMTAIDVGANFGYFSLLMGRAVGPEGSVWAVEANPLLAKLIRQSLAVSGIDRIATVESRAAYSISGETKRLYVPGSYMGGGTLSETESGFEVETVRLDDVLPERVDFVKIDAEGSERHILRGLHDTLSRNRDVQAFVEFDPRREGEDASFLFEILEQGFRIGVVQYDGSSAPTKMEDLLSRREGAMLHLKR